MPIAESQLPSTRLFSSFLRMKLSQLRPDVTWVEVRVTERQVKVELSPDWDVYCIVEIDGVRHQASESFQRAAIAHICMVDHWTAIDAIAALIIRSLDTLAGPSRLVLRGG